MRRMQCVLIEVFLLSMVLSAHARVRVSSLFADHMVVQRGEPVHIWGEADPGEAVVVEFRSVVRNVTADSLGRWQVEFPAGDAGGPFTLQIRATNILRFEDILVGDVWIASGQSNMGFALKDAMNSTAEVAAANLPEVRLLNVDQRVASFPQQDIAVSMPWSLCTPATAEKFSAVGYFFAREIARHEHVPVGIIESAWGGTPAEAWTSLTALSRDAALMPVFATWAKMVNAEQEESRREEVERGAVRKTAAPGDENLRLPWHPVFNAWAPGALYNGMIAPLTRFPIRGVIWYQGESNTDRERASSYARLFQTLIEDWRCAWRQGNFPFLFVQIANYKTASADHWPEVREAQMQALSLANTAMAVTIDIGDAQNIHPANKQEVGRRLALAARAIAYDERLEFSGPLYRSFGREADGLRLYFDHAESGLAAKGGELKGFEIAGADGVFLPAIARIDGATVIVSSPLLQEPRAVRYGWAGNPDCTLQNREGLPASPFRTMR